MGENLVMALLNPLFPTVLVIAMAAKMLFIMLNLVTKVHFEDRR